MAKVNRAIKITDEVIVARIYYIRGMKVMLDGDLAELYQVPTSRLNEQVKRNIDRFPGDFMFQLTEDEFKNLISQFATSSWGGRSVLNSKIAMQVNIQIMRIYTKMREMMLTHQEILLKLEQLERQTLQNTGDIHVIFDHLRQLLNPPQEPRLRIGFRRNDEQD